MPVTIKRQVLVTIWQVLPVSVKGALYRHHRKIITNKLASGIRRSEIRSFL